jgi:uncharacterized protein (DUF2345 family)
MSVTYDIITNSIDTIDYTPSATNTSLYMDSNYISTFGPIWVPRVYGKDLTAFEIASSGKIAITINDVHSLDISRSNWRNNNYFVNKISGYCNTAIQLLGNEGDVSVTLDTASNDIIVRAASNIILHAQAGDFNLSSSNDAIMNSMSNLFLNASDSNLFILFDHVTQSISLYTSNNYNVTTSNSLITTTHSNFSVDALVGNIMLRAVTSNITFFSSNDFFVTSSNVFRLTSHSNMEFTATVGEIKMSSAESNIAFFSSNNYTITSSNNYTLNTLSNISMTTNNGHIFLTSATSNTYIYSSNEIITTTSNNYLLDTTSNINLTSHKGDVSIRSLTSNFTLYTSNFFDIISSNLMTIKATSNVVIDSYDAHVKINSWTSNVYAYASNDMFLTTSNDATFATNSNMLLDTVNGSFRLHSFSNVFLNADNSNVYVNMKIPEDTLNIYALSNINVITSNNMEVSVRSNLQITTSNFWVYAQSNITMNTSNTFNLMSRQNVTMTACNDFTATTCNLYVTSLRDSKFTAESNIDFFISTWTDNPQNAIFSIQGGRVKVRGDIDLTGMLNTSNITSTTVVQNTLKVEDKRIIIAQGTETDSLSLNDSSGLIVSGYPGGDSNIHGLINKSFLWNHGVNGMDDLGTNTGIYTESFWELQGGSFRLTYKKNYGTTQAPNIKDVTFGFRMNEFEELELIKRFWYSPSNDYINKRIARFGRVLT